MELHTHARSEAGALTVPTPHSVGLAPGGLSLPVTEAQRGHAGAKAHRGLSLGPSSDSLSGVSLKMCLDALRLWDRLVHRLRFPVGISGGVT